MPINLDDRHYVSKQHTNDVWILVLGDTFIPMSKINSQTQIDTSTRH